MIPTPNLPPQAKKHYSKTWCYLVTMLRDTITINPQTQYRIVKRIHK